METAKQNGEAVNWQMLRKGVTGERASEVLRQLVSDLANVRGATGVEPEILATKYLTWSETAENLLRATFHSGELLELLQSERYWRIREVSARSIRPYSLIQAEVDLQEQHLNAAAKQIDHYRNKIASGSRELRGILLDTNVYIHGQPFENVQWEKLVGADSVTIFLPAPVLDELDVKKDAGVAAAGSSLRTLDRLLPAGAMMDAADVRSHVRLQVLDEPFEHSRLVRVDAEITRQASYYSSFLSEPIVVVTRDRGMRLRAESRGLRVVMLPKNLERKDEEEE